MTRRHGESVYQRGRKGGRAGQGVAVADLGWHAGRRDRREFTAPTKEEALRKRDDFLFKRQAGFTLPKGRPMYVAEWLEHWLYHVIAPHVEETTWQRTYRGAVEDYAMPFFARIRLDQVSEEDVEAWHAWLRQRESARGGPLAPWTIASAHSVLSAALKEAAARQRGGLTRNPCDNVRAPRRLAAEVIPPDPGQVRVLLAACKTWPN